jgi:tetratricopeptide (TPR) repeat protein
MRLAALLLLAAAARVPAQDAQEYYQLAKAALERSDVQQAETAVAKALELRPDFVEALLLKGQIFASQRRLREARAAFEKACQTAPASGPAHFQLGQFYDRDNRPLEAVAAFQKTVALDPSETRAWDYLALNLELLGEPQKAERAYRRGLAVNEGARFDRFLGYNYGRFLVKRNRLAEAKPFLDRAVELDPDVRAVHYERAQLNLRLDHYSDARRDAERALALNDPGGYVLEIQVYYLLATIYQRLGETELARKYAALARSAKVPLRSEGRQ